MDVEGAEYTDNATLLQDYQYDIELIRKACEEFCDMLRRLYRLNTRFEFQDGWSMATDEEAVANAEYRNWSNDLKLDLAVGDYALSTRITTLVDEEGACRTGGAAREVSNRVHSEFVPIVGPDG